MSIPSPTGVDRVLGGKYRVDELLGMGGFGAVYRGWHLLLDVPVAIKIAFHFDGTPSQRFRREARTLMRLRHPHIVRVYDYGREEDGRTYMVQEFVEGLPLDTVIGALGPLDPATAIRVALQTLDALGEAHRSGVVHRDVKPGNLMVRDHPDGVWVQLLDFGVAQVDGSVDALLDDASPERTRPGAALGTPAYMAPEQIQGRAAPASDLYALGVTLFRVLTGRCPFPQPAPAVYLAHLGEPVPALPSTVPAALAAVIHRAMAKAPADRYPSAEAMAAALEAAIETLPARPSSPLVARVPREARRPVGPLASAPTAPTAPTAPEEHAGEAPSAAALHPERASVEPISDLASPDLTSGDLAPVRRGSAWRLVVPGALVVAAALALVGSRWSVDAPATNALPTRAAAASHAAGATGPASVAPDPPALDAEPAARPTPALSPGASAPKVERAAPAPTLDAPSAAHAAPKRPAAPTGAPRPRPAVASAAARKHAPERNGTHPPPPEAASEPEVEAAPEPAPEAAPSVEAPAAPVPRPDDEVPRLTAAIEQALADCACAALPAQLDALGAQAPKVAGHLRQAYVKKCVMVGFPGGCR